MIPSTGLTNPTIDPFPEPDDPDLRLLAGARGCQNANNDSLVLLITYAGKKVLITGDAENISDTMCGQDEVGVLLDRYKTSDLLDVDLYIVGHHGSQNGTSAVLLQRLTPIAAIMSAGGHEPQTTFSAWGYGHPRQTTVDLLDHSVTGTRQQKQVYVMPGQHQYQNWTETKAVYCTCWDGNVTVAVDRNGISVQN